MTLKCESFPPGNILTKIKTDYPETPQLCLQAKMGRARAVNDI